jgi:probable selenium-dependent hydroxylase accessory protein YqeC
MNIYDGLGLDIDKKEVLSFVGGGGKTTTIFKLGQELKALGKKVLITTTTAIYDPEEGEYDYYFLGDYEGDFYPKEGSITILGREVRQGKLWGLSLANMDRTILQGLFDFILIEADGAKNKPIKAMASHEPVVSKYSTKTFGIMGMDCLGKPIESIVHRPELFVDIVGKDFQQKVDQKDVVKIVLHPRGLFKAAIGDKILILNKVGDRDMLMKGYSIRNELLEKGFKGSIILADIQSGSFY